MATKVGRRDFFDKVVMGKASESQEGCEVKMDVISTSLCTLASIVGAVLIKTRQEKMADKVLWQSRRVAHAARGRGSGGACCLGPAAPEAKCMEKVFGELVEFGKVASHEPS
mmetsp:Transcript_73845/g.192671  ORF Transcript_73845/g.192671 Transcript_73845/m.192671 type:complete len:112 (+) Transcript_73845:45-380(+)